MAEQMGRKGKKGRAGVEGNERKILVRSVNSIEGVASYLSGGEDKEFEVIKESYRQEDFHIVDLKLNKIYCDCLPSLPTTARHGSMVALGHNIFIFGGVDSFDDAKFKLVHFLPRSPLPFHKGASHLHLDLKNHGALGTWGPAPFPFAHNRAVYTSLHGDVYTFGTINLLAPGVLYAGIGSWKSLAPLPSELIGCGPSRPAIPDPNNNRILLHLDSGQLPSPSLYAFYPPTHQDDTTGTWRCLYSNFPDWDRLEDAALLDGVLYLHHRKLPNLVRAFEVATSKWLHVEWSTRVIDKHHSLDDFRFPFNSLCCLDSTNKILCLAVFWPDYNSPPKTDLFFFKFRAERCDSTICLTPLCTRSYEILSTSQVLDFLLL